MTNFLNSRNLIIGILTLAVGVFAAVGIAKVSASQAVTVTGSVVSFIVNPEGQVDGAILSTGEQIKFGGQTGEIVTSRIRIGDTLSATGYAGGSSVHGREFKANSLQIGGQTITISAGKPGPKGGPKGGLKGAPHHPRGALPPPPVAPINGQMPPPPVVPVSGQMPVPPAPGMPIAPGFAQPLERAKVSGTVKFVLVGGYGEAKGLILSDGTQLNLPKEVKDSEMTFSNATSVAVEGEIVRGQFGTFIKPLVLTIDNQIFSFNR